MDYSFLDALQQLMYRQKFKNIDHLKQILRSYWDMISQERISGTVGQWSKRLLWVIHLHGGHWTH